ncbi:hypothetical protein LguiA_029339 [Lonicera macranthoides]
MMHLSLGRADLEKITKDSSTMEELQLLGHGTQPLYSNCSCSIIDESFVNFSKAALPNDKCIIKVVGDRLNLSKCKVTACLWCRCNFYNFISLILDKKILRRDWNNMFSTRWWRSHIRNTNVTPAAISINITTMTLITTTTADGNIVVKRLRCYNAPIGGGSGNQCHRDDINTDSSMSDIGIPDMLLLHLCKDEN